MSPNLTQTIFALGADDMLVGVDDYSIYPDKARSLPKMGNFLNPTLETIIAAKPDLVLIVNTDENMKQMLSSAGLRIESFGNDSIPDILESIDRLGRLLDREDEAKALIDNFNAVKNRVDALLEGVPLTKVVLVAGRNPGRLQDIYVAGSSFMGSLLSTAGGENVFGDLGIPWPEVSIESLIGTDPDVIIDSTLSKGATEEEFDALLANWQVLPTLRAVSEGRVIVPREGWWQIPGPYIGDTILLLAHWLHPDIFPEEVDDPNKTL
jgi:iron complex transport system substrate-binding protein